MFRDMRDITGWTVFGAFLLVFVLAIVGLSMAGLTAPFLNLQRLGIQHSNQYVQSKVNQLTDLRAQYDRLETQKALYANNETVVNQMSAQQNAVLDQMWEAYNLIPDDAKSAVPSNIVSFLATHQRQ